jgi:hypothetical protein
VFQISFQTALHGILDDNRGGSARPSGCRYVDIRLGLGILDGNLREVKEYLVDPMGIRPNVANRGSGVADRNDPDVVLRREW